MSAKKTISTAKHSLRRFVRPHVDNDRFCFSLDQIDAMTLDLELIRDELSLVIGYLDDADLAPLGKGEEAARWFGAMSVLKRAMASIDVVRDQIGGAAADKVPQEA